MTHHINSPCWSLKFAMTYGLNRFPTPHTFRTNDDCPDYHAYTSNRAHRQGVEGNATYLCPKCHQFSTRKIEVKTQNNSVTWQLNPRVMSKATNLGFSFSAIERLAEVSSVLPAARAIIWPHLPGMILEGEISDATKIKNALEETKLLLQRLLSRLESPRIILTIIEIHRSVTSWKMFC